MDTIVVGVDGSEGARAALARAVSDAKLQGARLRVVCAWDVPSEVYAGGFAPGIDDATFDGFRENARAPSAMRSRKLSASRRASRAKARRSRAKQQRCCFARRVTFADRRRQPGPRRLCELAAWLWSASRSSTTPIAPCSSCAEARQPGYRAMSCSGTWSRWCVWAGAVTSLCPRLFVRGRVPNSCLGEHPSEVDDQLLVDVLAAQGAR